MLTGLKHRAAIFTVLALAACSRGGAEDPAVVMERAAETAGQLRYAAFDASFSYATRDPDMDIGASARGSLADGGRQLSFSFDADVTTETDGVDQTVSTEGRVIVADENEAYLNLSKVDGSVPFLPGIGLVPDEMLGRWLSVGSTASGSFGVTPDPSFIALQTQTLRVTNDRSYDEIDGHNCYVYDVTIDPAKMLEFLKRIADERGQPFNRAEAEATLAAYEAEGTVWIDAETSVIRKISWTFASAEGAPKADASFDLHLSDHDVPVEISPPADVTPLKDVLPALSLPAL